jgi:transposase
MPAATPESVRSQIWQLSLQGLDSEAIALALDLSIRTVRHLLAVFRAAGLACPPRFDCCGRRPSPAFASLHSQALDLRRQHPTWGAERILAQLFPNPPFGPRPDPSTLRRWLVQAGLVPKPQISVPRGCPTPLALCVHDIWPMDACEQKRLRDPRQKVCWLHFLEEVSSAALFTRVYNLARWAFVGGLAVQAALRDAFDLWGRPYGLRVDNGNPWVCPDSDLPTDLEMWLAGLGVALHKGRPNVPQDNARMERSQRTAQAWAEPWLCDTAEQLQKRMDEEDRIHREVFLFDGKQTRLQAYPELKLLGRPYSSTRRWEDVCWDHQAALALLGRRELLRKVDKGGCVSLYDHRVVVKCSLSGQIVTVRFAPDSQEWVFSQAGIDVGRKYAANLSAENIRNLQVSRRPGRSAERTQQRHARRTEERAADVPMGAVPPPDPDCLLHGPS